MHNFYFIFFIAGNPVCLSQVTCTEVGPRGHLLWNLNAEIAEGVKTIQFQYVSCETQQSLVVSEPIYIEELFRQSSLEEISQPQTEFNNLLKDDVPSVENESDAIERPHLNDGYNHYSPLWM